MEGGAIGGCACELEIGMAGSTSQTGMSARQRELGFGVVKGRGNPTCSRVAETAILTKLPIMGVIFRVTGIAILRGIDEDQVLMAGVTLQPNMLSGQWEWSSRVVKCRGHPSIGGVALTAILA